MAHHERKQNFGIPKRNIEKYMSTTIFELESDAKEVNMHAIVKQLKANMSRVVL